MIIALCLIALIIASITDLKTREVPDWLNYALIAVGLGIALLTSVFYSDWRPIAYSAAGLGVSLILGLIMYYTGQWGGGDSKMMWGLGAMLGLNFSESTPFLALFYINILFAGFIYGMGWIVYYVMRDYKKIIVRFKELLTKFRKIRLVLLIIILICAIIIFILPLDTFPNYYKAVLMGLLFFTYLVFYFWILVKAIEEIGMTKFVRPSKLTEGDWIVDPIKIKGKYVCGPKDLGIERHQIAQLIKAKIKKVKIKEGIPFIPSFLIAFVYTLVVGDIMIIGYLL